MKHFLDVYSDAISAISTAIIALFTIVLAIVTFIQSRLTRKSIELAREEFNSSHRPKLILRDAYTSKNWEQPIVVCYTLANVGATPATIIQSAVSVRIRDQSGIKTLPVSTGLNTIGEITINAGAHAPLECQAKYDKWPAEQIITNEGSMNHPLIQYNSALFFSGQIVYADNLNVMRHLAFFRKYDPMTDRFFREGESETEQLDYSD